MSEQEPQPQPQAQELDYVDVVCILQSDNFKEAIARVEERLMYCEDEAEIAKHAKALDELFGNEYDDGICNIAAGAYRRQEDGFLALEPELLNETGLIYGGIAIESIDGLPRVLIELRDTEGKMDYSVLPAALLQFEISENKASEGIDAILEMHIENARQLLSHKTFLRAPYEAQQGILRAISDCIERDLVLFFGTDAAGIESDEYYCIPDTATKVDLTSAFMDQSNNTYLKQYKPSGKIIGTSFLEQLVAHDFEHPTDAPLPYRFFSEFSKSGGVPCVILRDATIGVTYYIQLDMIRDIVRDDTYDSSDDDDGDMGD